MTLLFLYFIGMLVMALVMGIMNMEATLVAMAAWPVLLPFCVPFLLWLVGSTLFMMMRNE